MAIVAAALAAPFLPAWALGPAPTKPILTVSGKIDATNAGGKAVFDLAMLEGLPQKSFTTHTPWDNQVVEFSGPLLRDVLALVGARGTTLRAVALNDYKVAIPASDATRFDVIVAHHINGQTIPVRTKGPLFIVYPFDSNADLRNSTYYERSIWQLKAIEVE